MFSLFLGHHDGHHHDHTHDSSVTSVSIVSEGMLDLDEVLSKFQLCFNFGVLCSKKLVAAAVLHITIGCIDVGASVVGKENM